MYTHQLYIIGFIMIFSNIYVMCFGYIHPPLVAHGFQLQYPKANAVAAIDY